MLEEHIAVYNGHLLQNLDPSSPPTPPSQPSKYPIPKDFTYYYGGNATCNFPEYCEVASPSCPTNGDRFNKTGLFFRGDIPYSCFYPRDDVQTPTYWEFRDLKIAGEGAYHVLLFDRCQTGKPAVVLEPFAADSCVDLRGKDIHGFAFQPAFNAN